MTYKKKLIEVALPLDAINKASALEKSIRHGHPSTLHLWWARRPLAAARAVIFAQMVDDPSAHPDLFPTEEDQEKERQRLLHIIKELVKWKTRRTRRSCSRRGTKYGKAGAIPALKTLTIRGQRNCLTATSCPPSTTLSRRGLIASGGAAPGPQSLCERPESRGGADQQGHDRNPAQVCGKATGQPGMAEAAGSSKTLENMDWRPGACRGCALLREMDAR